MTYKVEICDKKTNTHKIHPQGMATLKEMNQTLQNRFFTERLAYP